MAEKRTHILTEEQIKFLGQTIIRKYNQSVYNYLNEGGLGLEISATTLYGYVSEKGIKVLFENFILDKEEEGLKSILIKNVKCKIQNITKTPTNYDAIIHSIIKTVNESINENNEQFFKKDKFSSNKMIGLVLSLNCNPEFINNLFFYLYPNADIQLSSDDLEHTKLKKIEAFLLENLDGFPKRKHKKKLIGLKSSIKFTIVHDETSARIVDKIRERYLLLEQKNDIQKVEIDSINIDRENENNRLNQFDRDKKIEIEGLLIFVTDNLLNQFVKNKKKEISLGRFFNTWAKKNSGIPIVTGNYGVKNIEKLYTDFGELGEIIEITDEDGGTGIIAIFKKSLLRYKALKKENRFLMFLIISLLSLILSTLIFFCIKNYNKVNVDITDEIFALSKPDKKYINSPFYIQFHNNELIVPSTKESAPMSFPINDLKKYVASNQDYEYTHSGKSSKIVDLVFLKGDSNIAYASNDTEKGLTMLKFDFEKNEISQEDEPIIDEGGRGKSDAVAINKSETYGVVTFYNSNSIGVLNLKSKASNLRRLIINDTTILLNPSGVEFLTDPDTAFIVCYNSNDEKYPKIQRFNTHEDTPISYTESSKLKGLSDIKIANDKIITCSDDKGYVYIGANVNDKETEFNSISYWGGSPTDIAVDDDGDFCIVAHGQHPQFDLIDIRGIEIVKSFTFSQPNINKGSSYLCRGVAVDWASGTICLSNEDADNIYCAKLSDIKNREKFLKKNSND